MAVRAGSVSDGSSGPVPSAGDRAWHGLGVSSGSVIGTIRIIVDPVGQAGQLRPGEVLVARATDPGWTPLFLIASAAVVERGGMLSHAAIVAREVGIPVVVDMTDATSVLRDGQRVRVNGSTGLVDGLLGVMLRNQANGNAEGAKKN